VGPNPLELLDRGWRSAFAEVDEFVLGGHGMKKTTPLAKGWPCEFAHPTMRGSIDPWIADEWQRVFKEKAPFGDLRNQWRREHCRTLNPYGDEHCQKEGYCALQFLASVKATIKAVPRSPVGYFKKVARMSAAHRADEGLTRRIRGPYSQEGTNVPQTPRPGYAGNETGGLQEGRGMRSPLDRPKGIDEVLGSLDLRPRSSDSDEGEAST
jgi:hypothetical protein